MQTAASALPYCRLLRRRGRLLAESDVAPWVAAAALTGGLARDTRTAGDHWDLDTRIVLLDALRGVCFVVMTVDHSPGNPVFRFSNPGNGLFGFFTAALGFVFLSGLVAGIVYEKERVLRGTASMVRRVLRRMRALYATQVLLVVLMVVAVEVHLRGASRWRLDLFSADPAKGIAFSASLIYEPGYLGILPMYIVFLFLTPLVLWQFDQGNVGPVLGLSSLIWIFSGVLVHLPEDRSGVDLGPFNPLCYQFLFVFGLAFGTRQLGIERLPHVARKWLIATCAILATLFLILRVQYALNGPLNELVDRISTVHSVEELAPLRALNFAAFGVVLYWLCGKITWAELDSFVFRWFALIGRHSLPVLAWSILVTYLTIAFFPAHLSHPLGLLATVLAAASLTVPAQLHALVARRRKRPLLLRLRVLS